MKRNIDHTKEKKIVIVLGGMKRGGAERVISYIANYLAEKGWRVWIALLLFNQVDYILHENVKIVDLAGTTQSRIKRLPLWLAGLRTTVKEIQPDTVLAFAARINIITQIACLGLKTKVVVSERNDPYSDGRSKGVDLLTNWLYPKAEAVVFQTRRASTYFEKNKLNNAVIIPNPVEVQCKAVYAKKGKIVTVGRLAEQKNQKMLINAFAEVKKKFPEIELHIFGEGNLRSDLETQIESLGLKESVFLRGNVIDIHQQISDAALFVLSSDYEGLSNALLEAMMMGLPCISTECAGSDEYIISGKNGLLTPVADAKAMVDAMCRLLSNDDEAQCLGKSAEKTVAGLYKDIIINKWYDVIS